MVGAKKNVYASYDEKVNGPFIEAIEISNQRGCVTWFDQFRLNPHSVDCPTDIYIRISGTKKYYRGTLLALARAEDLGEDFAQGEKNHPPKGWQRRDTGQQTVKTVFYVYGLYEDKKPPEVILTKTPQHPIYIPK